MEIIVTYQKNNGDILLRPRKTIYDLQIGETTSMGWKVLDIHYLYNGNYYHYADWCRVRRQDKVPMRKKVALSLARRLNKLAREI
ncbi:MAG: hypothetical protein J6T15_03650 [Bacilli bacterium]|nr:hypothetical protein [Bacilli bacterium]